MGGGLGGLCLCREPGGGLGVATCGTRVHANRPPWSCRHSGKWKVRWPPPPRGSRPAATQLHILPWDKLNWKTVVGKKLLCFVFFNLVFLRSEVQNAEVHQVTKIVSTADVCIIGGFFDIDIVETPTTKTNRINSPGMSMKSYGWSYSFSITPFMQKKPTPTINLNVKTRWLHEKGVAPTPLYSCVFITAAISLGFRILSHHHVN